MNVVIGKNNSGKSALIDIVEYACVGAEIPRHLFHKGKTPKLILSTPATEQSLRPVFREGSFGTEIHRNDNWKHVGARLVGSRVDLNITTQKNVELEQFLPTEDLSFGSDWTRHYRSVAKQITSPLAGRLFRKVAAERDVRPEAADATLYIEPNGRGFANAVSQILTRSYHPSELVETEMLQTLNRIFNPEARFSRIRECSFPLLDRRSPKRNLPSRQFPFEFWSLLNLSLTNAPFYRCQ